MRQDEYMIWIHSAKRFTYGIPYQKETIDCIDSYVKDLEAEKIRLEEKIKTLEYLLITSRNGLDSIDKRLDRADPILPGGLVHSMVKNILKQIKGEV